MDNYCKMPNDTNQQPTSAGQREQVWNSLGLRSWIRTDADSARIEELKLACANVSSGFNIWMSGSGDSSSVNFGMPDPEKCKTPSQTTQPQSDTSSMQEGCNSAGGTWMSTYCQMPGQVQGTITSKNPDLLKRLLDFLGW